MQLYSLICKLPIWFNRIQIFLLYAKLSVYFLVAEKCLYLWIYGWLGKNEWNIITWKKDFCSHLNMTDITGADYTHTKRVRKYFGIKNLGEYHDLYVQRDTLLLADAFDNFRNICLKICELDPEKFPSAPGLEWQVALKETKVRLVFSTILISY